MSKEIFAIRRGSVFHVFSDEDRRAAQSFPDGTMLKLVVSGARKQRAYRQLCCYKGSCKYIADLAINDRMDTQLKVDHMTKAKFGFIEDTIYLPNHGVQFLVKSLSYSNCDHPEATEFINKALAAHAELAGLDCVDDYVQFLREIK